MSLKPKNFQFEDTWPDLLETVKGVITCGTVAKAEWNDRFTDVYALCVATPENYSEKLYAETGNFIEKHVEGLHKAVSGSGDESLLKTYHGYWDKFHKGVSYMNLLYGYLNSTHVKRQKTREADLNYGGFAVESSDYMLEVGELAYHAWKTRLIDAMKTQLLTLLLNEITSDRSGGSVNQAVIHGVILSFVEVEEYKKKYPLELYEELFEQAFLRETGDYYRQEASKLKGQYSCSEYMEKVIQRLDNEDFRSRKFLHPSSYTKVTHECQQRMVADHLQFLHGECKEMVKLEKRKGFTNPALRRRYTSSIEDSHLSEKIDSKNTGNVLILKLERKQELAIVSRLHPHCQVHPLYLSNMYLLLKSISGGLSVLIEEVEGHIKSTALEAVKNLKGDNIPAQFVESMLQVHGKYTELIQSVFHGDKQFVGALDMACAAAINYKINPKQSCKSPELLAKYCDTLLKKSSKGASDAELDDKLASCITVFKYLEDKDFFQKTYSGMLAKRLIFGQSASMDAEESMINKLKQACGYEFTNKLHRMFTDMSISSDLNNKFSDFIKRDNTDLGINFSMLVLQAGAWPIVQSNLPTFALPQELEKSVQAFEMFYGKSFNGRKLTWMHRFCNVELKFNHLKRPYFVTMGTFPMSLLMLFNNSESVTLRDMLEISQLPEKELQKNVQSLVDSKILCLEWPIEQEDTEKTGVELDKNSVFRLNLSYANKRTKFKITAVSQKDTPQEIEQAHTALEEDRKLYLQAAIVRTMKARKLLKHNLLIQEVISQSKSRFTPSIPMIKKCIEMLIDKQYLERTQNSADEYSYMA